MNPCTITNDATLETWVLDATTDMTLNISTTVSEHPVERGAAIVDHVQQMPQSFSINGVVSETPTGVATSVGPERISKWKAFLEQLSTGQPCTIVSFRHGTLTNMVLESAPIPINSWRDTKVALQFRQIRVVSATILNLGPKSTKAITTQVCRVEEPVCSCPTDTGPQPTEDVSGDLGGSGQDSVARAALDLVLSYF